MVSVDYVEILPQFFPYDTTLKQFNLSGDSDSPVDNIFSYHTNDSTYNLCDFKKISNPTNIAEINMASFLHFPIL